MVNCTAKVFVDVDVLDHGHKASESSSALWEGPAYLSSPSRGWQQEAALEGVLSGALHVHTQVNLNSATRVVVDHPNNAGEYQVLHSALTSREWRLTLARRPHSVS